MVILQATDYNLQRLHHQHLSAPFPSTSLTAYLMTEEDFTCTYLFYGSIPSLGHFLHSCPCLRQKPEDFLPHWPHSPTPPVLPPVPDLFSDLRKEGRLVKCQGWETRHENYSPPRSTTVTFQEDR